MVSFLEENSLFSPRQCGFRKHHSTEAAVAYLTDCIRRNMDGLFTGAVLIDFRKAIDTIDHERVLHKLTQFGIRESELNWFHNYLSNRYQIFSIGGVQSPSHPVLFGVSQGTILGPLLFILYANDLPTCFHAANVLIYADDTVIFYGVSSPTDLELTLNVELKNLSRWASIN